MSDSLHFSLIKEFLDRQNSKVQKNCSIQVKNERVPFMLHISKNPSVKSFSPIIGFRQANSEDRTVPRICVGETLTGCMIGYSSMLYDFQNMDLRNKNDKNEQEWRGGYYIYALDYEVALAPNKNLVYDAEMSGERWLVNYTKGTDVYPHRKIGKIFIKSITTERIENRKEINCDMYIQVHEDVWLNSSTKLTKGEYHIKGPMPDQIKSYKSKNPYQIQAISKSEFEQVRKLTVSLLDFKDNKAFKW